MRITRFSEIARQFKLLANRLLKVVGHLTRVGRIQASRGDNSGMPLLGEPATMHLGTVLWESDGDVEPVDCERQQCRLTKDCSLQDAMTVGLSAFYEAMDRYVLTDISSGTVGEQTVFMHRNFLRPPDSAGLAAM